MWQILSADEASGTVTIAYSGPEKLTYGIELTLLDHPLVKKVTSPTCQLLNFVNFCYFYVHAQLFPRCGRASSAGGSMPIHQQPEVNYLPRFSLQLISLERYTLSVYRAGEIDLFENLDVVHIRLLVDGFSPIGIPRS